MNLFATRVLIIGVVGFASSLCLGEDKPPASPSSTPPPEAATCAQDERRAAAEAEAVQEDKNARWRDVFGKKEVIQRVRPEESFDYVPNPNRGTTTFQRFNGDPLYPDKWWDDRHGPTEFKSPPADLKNGRYPQTTISYCRWVWAVIEPEKNKYRWDIIDGALEAAKARGQTLQVRLQPYIADEDIPKFYWEMGGTPLNPKGRRKEIDHNNPAYIQHWGDLIRAFGKRYDGHPVLESFDIAYGGSCGEGGGNCKKETAEKLVAIYLESFKKTQLVSMLGTAGCTFAAKQQGRSIGWRADCFGDVHLDVDKETPQNKNWNHMKDLYASQLVECGVKDAWKTAPVTLETCWTLPYWKEKGWDIDWILNQGIRYHMSVFMPKSCYVPDEWKDKIAEFDRKIGYRFVLRQLTLPLEAKPGQQVDIDVFLDNVGCAPIYRPYKLAYRFTQGKSIAIVKSEQDIRKWMPDEQTWFKDEVVFPKTLVPGYTKIDIGIVDPATDRLAVRFAVKNLLEDGWYYMTNMDVLTPGTDKK